MPPELVESFLATARQRTQLLLAGRAESISALRGHLRAEGIPLSRVTAKAYWSTLRQGLD